MRYGNVLVVGNSGVGKSTLINAVLGEDAEKKAITRVGLGGVTNRLETYTSHAIPFRVVDTIGFEPSFSRRRFAINEVRKWSKKCAKEGDDDNEVNVIWFCVEGTSSRLFPEAIESLSKATTMWESVPVIVVITKSYSMTERERNIQLVHNAFATQKRYSMNLRGVIPVVAEAYPWNETAFSAPEGLIELIDATNDVMPEGLRAAAKDISTFKLKRKHALAQSVIGASIAAGVTVAAVPIPMADALVLSPIEVAEINALAKVYGIEDNDDSRRFMNSIVEAGTASVAAKAAIGGLKAIPGVNIAASVLNAIIAGCIVAVIGEASAYAFGKVYTGEKSITDINWIKRLIESKLSAEFVETASTAIKNVGESGVGKSASAIIADIVAALFLQNTSAAQGE